MKSILAVCLMLLGITSRVVAADASDAALKTIQRALEANESVKLSRWAYTVTTVSEGERMVEKHDPSVAKEHRWKLILKNGKMPTAEDLTSYSERRRRRRGEDGQQKLRDLIDQSTIKVLSNDVTHLTCSFRMKADDEEDKLMADKIQGTLVIRKEPLSVESLKLINAGRISKLAVLSIKEFKTHLQFRCDPIRGEPLPERVLSRIRGRALVVKSLNTDSESTYSDFHWVGP